MVRHIKITITEYEKPDTVESFSVEDGDEFYVDVTHESEHLGEYSNIIFQIGGNMQVKEIKFRAYAGGVMVYFGLGDIQYQYDSPRGFHTGQYRVNLARDFMQYTGIKDKNGKEIYEGDIINPIINRKRVTKYIEIVEYINGAFGYNTGLGIWHILEDANHQGRMSHWEVIGNIYENLELVECKPQK